ncbi:MAG TPA: M20/M25/M40 family metallo-hydrolase [Pyrinomonadaceae bacterium]|nr:M20/M25/M40 family metallo-hydrolase [Pyrinomonadaceae bacterium]
MENKLPSPHSQTSVLATLLVLLCVALVSYLAIRLQSPPAAVPESAPASEFSSGRALKHLASLARKPHPPGTEEHAAVRDYIFGQLSAAGLNPEIQETVAVNPNVIPNSAGNVQNVLARLKGSGGGKAIVLASHYDSVARGPGANDDAAAVASMLETLRALKTGAPLKNDVIFFFSDGEEAGLLGARAFASEHAWAKDVGLVLNFEARGSHGPSIMFETSRNNGWLIGEFARAAPHPVATSFAYEVYSRLPKDTDLTAFKEANLAGMNFAYINGVTHYHTALDNTQNLDERSLQHHGSYALALTRHFGNLDLNASQSGNAVYFDLLATTLVRYSEAWVIPFAVLTTLLFLAIVYLGLRRQQLTLGRLLLSFLLLLVGLALNAVLVTLLWVLIETLHPNYGQMHQGVTYNSSFYILGFVFLTLALASAIFIWLRKRFGFLNLAVGALLCWLLAMWLTSLTMPGASYLFTWPLFFSLLGLAYVIISTAHTTDAPTRNPATPLVLSLAAIPALVLLVPAIYHISAALPLFLSGAVMLLVLLVVGLLIPHLHIITSGRKWLLPAASLLVTIALLVGGTLTSGFDKEHPRPDNLFYGLDTDAGKAFWASLDDKPDEWTTQFFPQPVSRSPVTEFLPLITVDFMKSPAPLAPLAPPEATVLSDTPTNSGGRTLRLRINTPRQASVLSVYVNPKVEISSAQVNGKPLPTNAAQGMAETGWSLLYYAMPASGAELTLEVKTAQPVEMRVIDISHGLPQTLTQTLRARPDNIISTFFPFSDTTLVSKSFKF